MMRKTSPGGKALSVIMSVVLAIGLMPLPAFAVTNGENAAGGRSELTSQTDLAIGTIAGQDPETSTDPATEQEGEDALAPQGEDDSALEVQTADTVKEVGVGDTTSTTNPWTAYYYNTYSVQLYTGQEIGESGDITSIAFKLYEKSTDLESEFLKIYLAQTDDVSLATGTSATFSPVESDYTLVYDGTPTIKSKTSGWQTFEFNQNGGAYTYDKNKNLIVVVVTQTATETSGTPTVVASTTTEYTALSNKSDTKGTYTTLMTKPVSLTASQKRPDIQLSLETCAHNDKTFIRTVAPTCTERGYDLYHCNDCSKDVKLNETDALGHAWDSGQRGNKDGTIDANGKYMVYTCTRDSSHFYTTSADPTVWDGEASEVWTHGTGTADDPYLIESAANLAYLASQVNSGTKYTGTYFKQTTDLDLADEEWAPIGNGTSKYFAGTYLGSGHAIGGLNASTSSYVGLFGYVQGTSTSPVLISGLTIKGSVTLTGTSSYAGGISAYASYAIFSECANEAVITGGSGSGATGGIVGMFGNSTVDGCVNRAVVSSTKSDAYTGGIVGTNITNVPYTISNCYNTGDVSAPHYVGGILGRMQAYATGSTGQVVENCYNVGTIAATNSSYSSSSAGIVGYVYVGANYASVTKITNCYSASGKASQPIVGDYYPTGSLNCTLTDCSFMSDDDMKAAAFATKLGNAYMQGVAYPALTWEAPEGIPVISASALADATYVKDADEVTALSVTVTSDTENGTVAYQWYKATKADLSDAEAISGAITATYTPVTNVVGDFFYYCEVHNDVKKLDNSGPFMVQSDAAHIKVWSGKAAVAPTITTQPQSIAEVQQLATEGNTLTVAAAFAGSDETEGNCTLTYQWQVSDTEDGAFENVTSGGTEATYAASTAALGTKYYRCVVTNTREEQSSGAKSTTSDVASVKVVGLTITTEKQLADFRDSVNAGNAYEGATITLDANLDLSKNSEGYIGGDWTPIGNNYSKPFKGEFDGRGHTISGVNVSASSSSVTGLFGYVVGTSASQASIRNVTVSGEMKQLTGTTSYPSNAYNYVVHGGIAGYGSYVTFENCGNRIAIAGTSGTYACYAGIIASVGDGVEVIACYNKAPITFSGTSGTHYVGGLVGRQVAKMTVQSSYNTGAITNNATSSSYAGGLIAYPYSGSSFVNCYNEGLVTGASNTYWGGISGGGSSYNSYGTNDDPSYVKEGSVSRGDYGIGGTTNLSYFKFVSASEMAEASFLATLSNASAAEDFNHSGVWLAADFGSDENQTTPALYWEKSANSPVLDSAKPSDASIGKNESVTLEVADMRTEVTTGVLSYQWKVSVDGTVGESDDDAPGASTAVTYNPPTSAAGVYYYYCVVTNTVEGKTYPEASRVAKLTVTSNDPAKTPVVNIAGPSQVGQFSTGNELEASISYTAEDDGVVGELTYQWYKLSSATDELSDDKDTGNAISGAVSATYTVADTATIGTAYYACKVTNTFGDKVQSGQAVHTVEVTALHIKDELELKAFRDAVNAGSSYEGADVYLDADITLTESWTPIGRMLNSTPANASNKPFKGSFHGQGHTISGINVTTSTGGQYDSGFFGFVFGGTVEKLVLEGSVTGDQWVGGVAAVAANGAKFYRVGSNLTVSTASTSSPRVGGIVGHTPYYNGPAVEIIECYNKGSVTGYMNVGGILGYEYATTTEHTLITSCYNTGNVTATGASVSYGYAGGIVGSQSSGNYQPRIYNCYNVGTIAHPNANSTTVAGSIYGYTSDFAGSASDKNYFLNGSVTRGSSTGLSYAIGGTSGTSSYATGMDDADMKLATFVATLNNADAGETYSHANTWVEGSLLTTAQDYPALYWEAPASADTKTDLSEVDVAIAEQVYTGEALVPAVKAGEETLESGTNYTISFVDSEGTAVQAANLINAGTYTATIVGAGDDYKGQTTAQFVINRAKIATADEPVAEADELTVTDDQQLLVAQKSEFYTLTWAENMDATLKSADGTAIKSGQESGNGAYGKSIGVYTVVATPDDNHQWTIATIDPASLRASSLTSLVAQAVLATQSDDDAAIAPKSITVTIKEAPADPANTTALEKAIKDAEAAIDGVQGSTSALASTLPDGTVWADSAELTSYKAAINAAKAVLDNSEATQAEVDAAATTLSNAPAPEKNTVAVNRSALSGAVSDAQSDLSDTTVASSAADVASGEKFATPAQAEALKAAIDEAAEVLADASASQAQVDAARAKVAAAKSSFDSAKGTGTKSSTPATPDTPATDPEKPADSGASSGAAQPSQPVEPEQPGTSDDSGASSGSADPDTSGDSAASDDSGTSEEPVQPESPAEKASGVVRLQGQTALDTMAAIVAAGNYEQGGTVVLTTIAGYWDALTAAGVAGMAGAPVLMTDGEGLSAQTSAIIQELAPSKVIVCGGPAAVTDDTAAQALAVAASGASLVRLYGANAVGTACDIYSKAPGAADGQWATTAIVATNAGYWDALAAAPLSYALHMPIFLTDGSESISDEALQAMRAGGVERAYIAGGVMAVSENVESQLASAGVEFAGRLAGETAVETSEAVASFGLAQGMTCDSMGVATNDGYWDALSGAALCGRLNSVIVLAGDSSSHSVASGGFVDEHASSMDGLYIFGGPAAVDTSVESTLKGQVD